MKAKCTNCGVEMDQEHSPNWNLYCNKEECHKAFMEEAMKGKSKKKK